MVPVVSAKWVSLHETLLQLNLPLLANRIADILPDNPGDAVKFEVEKVDQ